MDSTWVTNQKLGGDRSHYLLFMEPTLRQAAYRRERKCSLSPKEFTSLLRHRQNGLRAQRAGGSQPRLEEGDEAAALPKVWWFLKHPPGSYPHHTASTTTLLHRSQSCQMLLRTGIPMVTGMWRRTQPCHRIMLLSRATTCPYPCPNRLGNKAKGPLFILY